jgi:hypothetical protein
VPPPEPGTSFPDIPLADARGVRAPRPRGETLFAFFHTTCPTSEMAWPYLERIRRIGREGSLSVVAVSQDGARETDLFNRRLGVNVTTLYDPPPWKASEALRLENVPAFFHVGAGGEILDFVEGFQRAKMEELAGRAATLAGGKAPEELFLPGESVPAIRPG